MKFLHGLAGDRQALVYALSGLFLMKILPVILFVVVAVLWWQL